MRNFILIILLCCLAISYASAQDSDSTLKKRKQKSYLSQDRPWAMEIPIWVPGFRGELAYGDIDLEGEDGGDPGDPENPDDDDNCGVFCRLFNTKSYLKFYLMTRFSYDKNRVMVHLDGFSATLGESVKFNYNDKEIVQVNIRTLLSRAYAGYSFYQHTSPSQRFRFNLYGYGGVRLHAIKIDSDLNDAINNLDLSLVWAEPLIGLYTSFTTQKWLFTLQGDIGGLPGEKRVSFMINALGSYRINRLLSVKLGWNTWDIRYKDTYKGEDLKLKVDINGPSAAIAFHF